VNCATVGKQFVQW